MTISRVRATPALVQAVRDAVDVVDVASDLTRLKRHGKRYQGLCPFHKEKTPSFSVDPAQGLYYCFGCGAGGDAIRLYMESSGDDFTGAIEALARRYGIPLPKPTASGRGGEPERDTRSALEAAAEYFTRQLERSAFARDYLDRRRIPAELRRAYGLGYAPDGWENLLQALAGRVPLEDLVAAGLVGRRERDGKPYDRFRQRLMFPIHSPGGQLVGFGGRTLGEDRAKYVNTAETDAFHKSRLLYGFHLAKRELREGGKALLVEGYFDVLGAAASGVTWAVAGMGTSLTREQARLLARYCEEVIVAYDGDEAGETACRRSLPILLQAGLGVRRARFPEGHDPDSLRLEAGPEAVTAAIEAAADAVAAEVEGLLPPPEKSDPRTRARAASAVLELLSAVRDPMVRYGYAQAAAERLGLPVEMLLARSHRGRKELAEGDGRSVGERRRVVTQEDTALALLLRAGTAVPPAEELPPAEIFFDPDCRNIYSAFCALYKGAENRPPEGSEVVSRLGHEGGALDRAARLLLEDADPDAGGGLQKTLDTLLHRWRKRRQAELMQEIRQAQQAGDQPRLTQLLEEKTALSRSLHPATTGKLW